MRNESSVELTAVDGHREVVFAEDNFEPAHITGRPVPPPDGGKDAWLFLIACFMFEATIWGFPYTFGIFQEHYSSNPLFAGSKNIAVIGTCGMGIMYLDAPFVFASLQKWPRLRRPAVVIGIVIMATALVLSSFSQNVTHLILTQGILYAIGGSIAYSPTILFVNEWFIKKRGMAFGFMWAGTGVAGVVLPLVLQALLARYGFRTTLRIWAIALSILTLPLSTFVKPRVPLTQAQPRQHSSGPLFDLRFMLSPSFIVLQACNILESLGYFMPAIYLPTYASEGLGVGGVRAALTVIAVNIASVFGCIVMGGMIDRWHVTTCILVSTVGATVGVFVLWGLATNLGVLYIFCVVYGLFAGSFSSTWTGIIKDVQRKHHEADSGIVFGFLAFGRGVGNVVSGPLSEALVRGKPWIGEGGMAYGTGYGPLITFTGVSALLGGLSFLVRRVGWLW
ncbi:MFS general substrate transporter [Trichodelitschia bisporula]|uniref:MFS general substrate transporter n=1 Tax=Trichodelitschia bisporula TaxID=703511 RepID=A0A6G1I8F3_9PEZI|nr:MFS general substrate transporter [Trichodelitschia bisporula]